MDELQARTDAPFLVGGHNALQHMLRGTTEYALVGPARNTIVAAVDDALAGGPPRTPGLWWDGPDGLECGPPGPDSTPQQEVLPYTPFFDWEYLGPPRAPGSNLRVPSVVVALGCVYNAPLHGTRPNPAFEGVEPRVAQARMSEAAVAEYKRLYVDRTGGCTFCVFRFQPHRPVRRDEVEPVLRPQLEVLRSLGARGASLQTEHPIPLLAEALDLAAELGFDELHIRTLPRLVLPGKDALERALARADGLGIQVVLGQVGFEAFDEHGLRIFHKGITVEENRAAARLLTEFTERFECFEGTAGHGFIPLHPWTRPGDLRTNIEACKADAPWLLHQIDPRRRLEIYNEWSPIFWKAEDDGLLVEAPDRFGWDFRFDDDGTGEVVAVARTLLTETSDAAWTVLDRVLGVYETARDPGVRRAGYLAYRSELRAAARG